MNENITMREVPSATALRSKRHRDRRKDGVRCIRFRVNEATLDHFVRLGLLTPDARHDPRSIERVFYGLAKVGLAARDVLLQMGALRRDHANDWVRIRDALYDVGDRALA
jgi:hypothetical protein